MLASAVARACCHAKGEGVGVTAIRGFCSVVLAFIAWALLSTTFYIPQAAAQEPEPAAAPPATSATPAAPADPVQGKSLFEENCSTCHGVNAGGGDGPDLRGVPASLGDAAVENIIRRGLSGTAMPGFYNITDKGAANIVAYLRTLSSTLTSETATGDAQNGEAVYNSSGCAACHMIEGQGGSIGPELTRIGSMRGPSNLKARLLDPGANLPKIGGGGMMGNSWTEYAMYRAVEKNGHVVEGIRVGEDSFTIVLRDATGKFHGFSKPDLRSLEREPDKSLMPSFKDTLSAAQLDDLVAYLMSLKGAQ
jgi:cytochrome c oxidase cbb3-type subunit III